MIACYAKNEMGFEALELFREMVVRIGPNSVTMVSVLQACGALGALEQGKMIHGYIVRNGLDSILPVVSGLVTMYTRCGKLEVAKLVFDKMCRRDEFNPRMEQLHAMVSELSSMMKEDGYVPRTNVVLYDLEEEEKERILLGHSEKLALAFGLINTSNAEPIRITKNLRLCEDCHSFTKYISKLARKEILVRDVNRFHHFRDGVCSCGDFW
ncbi:Pentatricopeptide repeat-containing protein At3g46790, chloroplastic [Linum perenne]